MADQLKLRPLAGPLIQVLKQAQADYHRARAIALNTETELDEHRADLACRVYFDMCQQALCCTMFDCYERTLSGEVCEHHADADADAEPS